MEARELLSVKEWDWSAYVIYSSTRSSRSSLDELPALFAT